MPILHIRNENGDFIPINAIRGDRGKSAYEQAKEGGYTGTEEEFIATLNGLRTISLGDLIAGSASLDSTTVYGSDSLAIYDASEGLGKRITLENIRQFLRSSEMLIVIANSTLGQLLSIRGVLNFVGDDNIEIEATSNEDGMPTIAIRLSETIPIEKGGTGAKTAEEALENLGAIPKTAGMGLAYFVQTTEGTKTWDSIAIADSVKGTTKINKIPKYASDLEGATQFTLLWENALPRQSYSSGTITISNSSEYDLLIITSVNGTSCIMGRGTGEMNKTVYGSTSSQEYFRSVTWNNESLSFDSLYSRQTNHSSYPQAHNNYSVANNYAYCVPYQIYGVKL